MEVRTITQCRIYVLVLNTFGRCEDGAIAAISDDYNKLVNFYNSQLLKEGFRDEGGWYHSFCEGALYSFNPCNSLTLNDCEWYGHGIHDDWIPITELENLKHSYFFV